MTLKINLNDPHPPRRFLELLGRLDHVDHGTRFDAIRGIYLLARSGVVATDRVVEALSSRIDSPATALLATTALTNLDVVTWLPRLQVVLLEALRNPGSLPYLGWSVDWAARTLTKNAEREVIASLRASASAALRDGNVDALDFASATLGGCLGAGDVESIRPLEALLTDSREPFRLAAETALRRAATPAATAAIERSRGAR